MSLDKEQGTTHLNALEVDGLIADDASLETVVGSTMLGSSVETPSFTGSQITGSGLTLPSDGALGGMSEVVTGTTGAASLQGSFNHSLVVTPSWVGLTAHGTNGSNTINLVTKGTGQIIVESAIGTVAFEALLIL